MEADFKELGRSGDQKDDFILLMAALTASSLIIIKDCNSRIQGVVTEGATPTHLISNSTHSTTAVRLRKKRTLIHKNTSPACNT